MKMTKKKNADSYENRMPIVRSPLDEPMLIAFRLQALYKSTDSKIVGKLDPSKVPTFLGGVVKDGEDASVSLCRLPQDSIYRTLPRVATKDLPPLHKHDRVFASKAVETEIKGIFQGNLFFMTETSTDGRKTSICASSCYPLCTKKGFYVFEYDIDGRGATTYHAACRFGMERLWTKSQIEAIIWRILHIYLREWGADLPKACLQQFYVAIDQFYSHQKFWKDMLDLNIIMTDLEFATNSEYTSLFLNCVAKSLETVGKLEEAAKLWEELGSGGIFKHLVEQKENDQNMTVMKYYNNAAEAYFHCRRYPQAEFAFLSNLYHTIQSNGRGLGVGSLKEETSIHRSIVGLLKCYACWINDAENQTDVIGVMQVEATLGSLAAAAGFEGSSIQHYDAVFRNFLKSKYRQNKNISRRILETALLFRPININKFRSKLVSTNKKGGVELVLKAYKKHTFTCKTVASSQLCKTNARSLLYQENWDDNSKANCDNCLKMFQLRQLMTCPCRTVYYCSKTCQHVDWKKHKSVCSLRKNKS